MSDLRQLLDALGLGEYAEAFEAERVDIETLLELSDDDLKDLGLPLGPRRKLLKQLREGTLRPDGRPEQSAPDAKSTPAVRVDRDAERRQLTVMFCDLVGSVALAERMDVEDYRDLLAQFRTAAVAAVERFDGYIARHQGDGLLVYFGYPQAHEDDAERALHAGLAIIESIRNLDQPYPVTVAVRVGVATGPAVVGDLLETSASSELAALGQTPNLAARLQGAAAPDELVVSETTYRLAGRGFETTETGPLELKGFGQPVTAYRVRSQRARDETEGANRSPLVGRTAELILLEDRWMKATEGAGQVVLVSAEPGVGKSRLAEELRSRLANQNHAVVSLHCSPYHSGSAFHPVTVEFRRRLDDEARRNQSSPLRALEQWMGDIELEAARHVPILGPLLDVPIEPKYEAIDLSGAEQRERSLESLIEVLAAMAGKQPVLLLGEDLHWVDPSTQALLSLAIDLARSTRLMVLLTHRPEYSAPWTGERHLTEIRLNHLTETECKAFVQRLMGAAAPPELLERIVARTDGVPLYIEELSQAVSEATAGSEVIPETLRDALTARLDRLGPAKEIAQAAAVLGREFPSGLVAAVAGRPSDQVTDALRALVTSGLVHPIRGGETGDHQFKHALVRDAAYDSLLRSSREALHRRAADALATNQGERHELVAHHLEAAGSLAEAEDRWVRAATAAFERGAYEESEVHRRRALEIAETRRAPASRLLDLARSLAQILHLNGRRIEADALMSRQANLAAAVEDHSLVADYHSTHGLIQSFLGQRAPARESYEQALTLARAADDRSNLARALIGLGWEDIFIGRYGSGYERFIEGVALLDSSAPLDPQQTGSLEFGVHGLAMSAAQLGRFEEARVAATRFSDALTPSQVAPYVELTAGDWDRALEFIDALLATDPPPFHDALLTFQTGRAYLGRGDVEHAVEVLEEAVDKARRYRSEQVQLSVALSLSEAYLAADRVDDAHDVAVHCLDESDRLGVSAAGSQNRLGHVALHRGKLKEARAFFEDFHQHHVAGAELPSVAHARVALAKLAAAEGDSELACEHLLSARESYREMGMRFYVHTTLELFEDLGIEPPTLA